MAALERRAAISDEGINLGGFADNVESSSNVFQITHEGAHGNDEKWCS